MITLYPSSYYYPNDRENPATNAFPYNSAPTICFFTVLARPKQRIWRGAINRKKRKKCTGFIMVMTE